ncbi:MAG: hypothetical protein AAF573_00395 [Bacteroidota bacterium]
MNFNIYSNLTEAISGLQLKGFSRTFSMENKKIRCLQTDKTYTQEELQIIEYHRFKSDQKHPDESIIFIIECADGKIGYIISSERNMASIKLLQFMDKVKIKPRNLSRTSPRVEVPS